MRKRPWASLGEQGSEQGRIGLPFPFPLATSVPVDFDASGIRQPETQRIYLRFHLLSLSMYSR